MSVRFDVEVSLALGATVTADPATWSWTDITSRCMVRDGGVTIRRGRVDWQSNAQPATCDVLVNNSDGRFSRLNPLGVYYGTLRKNTPLRVRACATGGSLQTRFVGFISELPPRWDPSGKHFWVPLHADGVLRRLGTGNTPAKSYLRGVIDSGAPQAYWPLEDGSNATQAASAVAGVAAMTVSGTVTFGSGDAPNGSAAAPVMTSGGSLTGQIPAVSAPGDDWAVEFIMKVANSGSTFTPATWFGTGSVSSWSIQVTTTQVNLQYTAAGSTSTVASVVTSLFDAAWHGITVYMNRTGADIFAQISVDANSSSGTVSAQTTGILTSIRVGGVSTGELVSIGHVLVQNSNSFITGYVANPELAGAGDLASARINAVAANEGILVDVATVPGLSQTMGPQLVKTALELFREAEAADAGVLVERLIGKLGYDSHLIRENLTAALALTYTQGHITGGFEPADDDRSIRNDVTALRTDGSSARVIETTGTLGTAAVGTYDEEQTVNVFADNQLLHQAGWRVNLGTVEQYRYSTVNLMFHRNASLLTSWLSCDISSRVTISGLPANMPPDVVDLIIEGYAERINRYEWTVDLNLAPYSPYKIFVLATPTNDAGTFVGRLAEDSPAAIRAAISSGATSITIDPNKFRWTAVADDFSPNPTVRFGGETATISGTSTTAGTFVAAGALSHADNAAVTPALYAGATGNDLILVVARVRSTSAASLATPSGYTRLPIAGLSSSAKMQVYAKIHSGSESNPTVTPSGGAAGDTVSAYTLGFRNMPITLTDLASIVVASQGQLNGSAQDIAYPGLPIHQAGCVVLVLGGKDAVWTSVATLSGFTEAVDGSTALGNDQGLVADYVIQTTPTDIAPGTFSVTGGSAAASHGITLALAAGFQTLTVASRSTNGVVKAHAAGTLIGFDNALRMGL